MKTKAKRPNSARHSAAASSADSEVLKKIVDLKSQHGVDITDYYKRIAHLASKAEAGVALAFHRH